MATKREQEILALIKQDSLITQAQLAEKTGTTRSNIGSHISNLIKEGLIVGRGYVFPAENEVTVIGAVNLDSIGGCQSPSKYYRIDSGPSIFIYRRDGL